MLRVIDQIAARLNLLRMTSLDKLTAAGIDLDAAPMVLGAARTAVADGVLGFALLIADHTTSEGGAASSRSRAVCASYSSRIRRSWSSASPGISDGVDSATNRAAATSAANSKA
ncbi:hypothetical protein ACFT7S_06265 [Streptomyces sp. NPDC057136]|uniref:hypothetical protein n=1 Tax=Streptomyces sp. NPDC057136 TaxID=3346029 RepID=UPI00363624B1